MNLRESATRDEKQRALGTINVVRSGMRHGLAAGVWESGLAITDAERLLEALDATADRLHNEILRTEPLKVESDSTTGEQDNG